MSYKVNVWRNHAIVDTYRTDDLADLQRWYGEEWRMCEYYGECYCVLFVDNEEADFTKTFELLKKGVE